MNQTETLCVKEEAERLQREIFEYDIEDKDEDDFVSIKLMIEVVGIL